MLSGQGEIFELQISHGCFLRGFLAWFPLNTLSPLIASVSFDILGHETSN